MPTNVLSEKGHEVYVIAPMDDTGFRGRFPFEIVDYYSIRLSENTPYKIGVEALDPHFEKRMNMIDLDICHAHSPAFAGQAALHYAKKHHKPLVASFHSKYYDDVLKTTGSKILARLGTDFILNFYNQCDEVWAVSHTSADVLRDYGFKGQITVMPNGTDVVPIRDSQSIGRTRRKYGLDDNRPVFLYVGQINWKKNLENVIKATSVLKKEGFDFHLVMAGCGPDEKEVRNLAVQAGISDNLVMTGHLTDMDELNSLYSIASLFLFPSLYDTYGLVVREAACMHTPSIVIEGSCAAEDIKDMYNGFSCKNSVIEISNKIRTFLTLPQEKKDEISDNAFNTLPVAWRDLMDTVVDRYSALVDRYRNN